jgi:hypothetical protein
MAYSLADVFHVTVKLPHQPYKTQVTVGPRLPFPPNLDSLIARSQRKSKYKT